MNQNKAKILPFSKTSNFLSPTNYKHDKGPSNPASEWNHYIFVIFDHFSNFIVTVPTPKNNGHYAVN